MYFRKWNNKLSEFSNIFRHTRVSLNIRCKNFEFLRRSNVLYIIFLFAGSAHIECYECDELVTRNISHDRKLFEFYLAYK